MVVLCVLYVTFCSLIYVQDNNKLICSNKAATGKSFVVANSDNLKTYEAAAFYLPQKAIDISLIVCRGAESQT